MAARRIKPNWLAVLRTPGWPRIVLLRKIAAAVLVLIAVVTLVQSAIAPPENSAQVFVAKADLAAGEPLEASDIQSVVMPLDVIPETAVKSDSEIVGSIPIGPIGRGEIITNLRLVSDSLVAKIAGRDEKHRASHIVSIRPNDPILVAHLNAGDAVDIVSTQKTSGDADIIAAGGRVITALNVESERDAAILVALPRDQAAQVAAAGLSGPLSLLLTATQ